MNTKFKSSGGLVVLTFIKSFLLLACGITLIVGMVMRWLDVMKEYFLPVVLSPIYILFIIAIAAYIAVCRRNIQVHITETQVQLIRMGKIYESFEIEKHRFSSNVVQNVQDGIVTSTDKFLDVTDSNNVRKSYKCYNFSKETFNELIAIVSSFHIKEVPETEKMQRQCMNELKEYRLPKKDILDNLKKNKKVTFITIAVIFAILLVVLLISAQKSNLAQFISVMIGFVILLAVVMLIPISIMHFLYVKIERLTPEKVQIFANRLIIGEKTFNLSEIRQIKATPPTYTTMNTNQNKRKLIVITAEATDEFLMGDIVSFTKGRTTCFNEYEKLCNDLSEIMGNDPARFRYEIV